MKIRKTKKGFTIVELVIVIAVIGILAAILIPTFIGLTNRANEASDNALVNNLNKALKMEEGTAGHEKSITMHGAIVDLKAQGYSVEVIQSKSGKTLVWDQEENQFLLNGQEDAKTGARYWKIVNNKAEMEDNKYSYYAGKYYQGKVSGFKYNFDAGDNPYITDIRYSASANDNVIIRTNSVLTTLIIDAPLGTVTHYGNADVINVTAIAKNSYHENGAVSRINLNKGKVEINANAYVGEIGIDKKATAETVEIISQGTIFNSVGVDYVIADETKPASDVTAEEVTSMPEAAASIVSGVETLQPDPESGKLNLSVDNADALINLANAHSQGLLEGNIAIEITKDIDLSGKVWVPFGLNTQNPFEGSINGNNKTIKGLSYSETLEGKLQTFKSQSDEGTPFALIGYAQKNVTVKNLTIECNIDVANGEAVAGFIGVYNNLTEKGDTNGYTVELNNCKVNGSISAKHKVSGFVGTGFITQSSNFAKSILNDPVRAKTTFRFVDCAANVNLLARRNDGNAKIGGFASGLPLFYNPASDSIGGDALYFAGQCSFSGNLEVGKATNYLGAFCGYLTGSGNPTVNHAAFTNNTNYVDVYQANGLNVW